MIELISQLPDGVAGFRMSGHVTDEDYRQVVLPLMKDCLAKTSPTGPPRDLTLRLDGPRRCARLPLTEQADAIAWLKG